MLCHQMQQNLIFVLHSTTPILTVADILHLLAWTEPGGVDERRDREEAFECDLGGW